MLAFSCVSVCIWVCVGALACVCVYVHAYLFVLCARVSLSVFMLHACFLTCIMTIDLLRQVKSEMVSGWVKKMVVTEARARGRDGGGVRVACVVPLLRLVRSTHLAACHAEVGKGTVLPDRMKAG